MKRTILLLLGIGLICVCMLGLSSRAVAGPASEKGTVVVVQARDGVLQDYLVPAHWGSSGVVASAITSSRPSKYDNGTMFGIMARPGALGCEFNRGILNDQKLYGRSSANFVIWRWAASGVFKSDGFEVATSGFHGAMAGDRGKTPFAGFNDTA